MDTKKLTYLGLFIGSSLGGYLPTLLWNADLLSLSGLFCSLVGGLIGIWVGYRIGQSF